MSITLIKLIRSRSKDFIRGRNGTMELPTYFKKLSTMSKKLFLKLLMTNNSEMLTVDEIFKIMKINEKSGQIKKEIISALSELYLKNYIVLYTEKEAAEKQLK